MDPIGIAGLVIALLGWAYQLGYMQARVNRNEKDVDALNKEFRKEISESLRRIHEKIDQLPCKNPGWSKEKC